MTAKRIIGGVLVVVMIFSLVASITGCTNAKKTESTTPPTIEETIESTEDTVEKVTEESIEDATEEVTESVEETEIVKNPDSVSEKELKEAISAELDKSIFIKEALLNVSNSGLLPFDCIVEDAPEDFLPGFTNKVNGYHEAAMMAPIIGSHPFIVYLFLADDVDALKTDLMREADPRWNICTEATVVVCEEYGEIVLFAMLP